MTYSVGVWVQVWNTDNRYIGLGIIIDNTIDVDVDGKIEKWDIPQIRMNDGSIILGCECWWKLCNDF